MEYDFGTFEKFYHSLVSIRSDKTFEDWPGEPMFSGLDRSHCPSNIPPEIDSFIQIQPCPPLSILVDSNYLSVCVQLFAVMELSTKCRVSVQVILHHSVWGNLKLIRLASCAFTKWSSTHQAMSRPWESRLVTKSLGSDHLSSCSTTHLLFHGTFLISFNCSISRYIEHLD